MIRMSHCLLALFNTITLAACKNHALRGSGGSGTAQGTTPPAPAPPAVVVKAPKWEWRVFTQDLELARRHGWSERWFQSGHEDNGDRNDVYVVSVGNDAGVKLRDAGAGTEVPEGAVVEVKTLADVRPSRSHRQYQKTTGQTLSSARALCGRDASGRPKFEPSSAVVMPVNKTTGKHVIAHVGGKKSRVIVEQNIVSVDGQEKWYSIAFVGKNLEQVEADITHHFGLAEDWNVTTLGDEGFFVGGFPEFTSMLAAQPPSQPQPQATDPALAPAVVVQALPPAAGSRLRGAVLSDGPSPNLLPLLFLLLCLSLLLSLLFVHRGPGLSSPAVDPGPQAGTFSSRGGLGSPLLQAD